KSNEPLSQAAKMCRKRGRIVLVGVTGLELSRADFYEKELSFQVSCSYGPGRYDPAYEEGGQDYPVGFVRWTEQRNFEAVLDLMASGQIDGAQLHTVVSAGGVSAAHFGRKFGFSKASTDESEALADPAIDTVVIATRHNVHARQVLATLRAGKHVFCEKPLCLALDELTEI